ncbi:Mannosyltransferase putative [Seminavis robusta]|uniref:Mannosyltransferase putative n=1 Tax=Seminavis robusta TaxID=568900 RepID=A0A9N8HD17_9STRA|nr:Mannosyltransferase putative [Seminavis robusta]|eukprot:Sro438_g143090.1 Mannosyltransferase putative (570) ;mRNA; r:44418-46127
MDPQGKSKHGKWQVFGHSFFGKIKTAAVERGRRLSWEGRELTDKLRVLLSVDRVFLLVVALILSTILLPLLLNLLYRGGANSGLKHQFSNKKLQSHPNRTLLLTNEEANCVAWRATGQCSPDGPLLSQSIQSFFTDTDLSCSDYVPSFGSSGYCELVSAKTGRTIRAFRKSCYHGTTDLPYPKSRHFAPAFRCEQAVDFLNYQHQIRQYKPKRDLPMTPSERRPKRGILLQIYPSCLPSVFTIIKLLRHEHNCQLPIELWHMEGEIRDTDPLVRHIVGNFDHIEIRTIAATDMGAESNSYMSKPYAIAYSNFDQILFLDSDNFPFQDPTFLFETPEFQANSAMFWKDFWNTRRNDYIMTHDSLVWELLGIPTDDDNATPHIEMEMESGQMVIDRRKSVAALHALLYLAKTFGDWLEPLVLVWGDKDLFRLAYYMTSTPFHYIKEPPGLAGRDVVLKWISHDKVCGITMVQHSPKGDPLFFHRNIAKLSKESDLFKVWQKGVKFVGSNPNTEYAVEGRASYYWLHGCYHPKPPVRPYFKELDYRGSEVEQFEEKILRFAKEGIDIIKRKQ